MSAVVGRRNNWLLSPGKFPDQFLFVIDKNRKLFYLHRARTSKKKGNKWNEEEEKEEERGLRKQVKEVKGKLGLMSERQREAGESHDATDTVSVCQHELKQTYIIFAYVSISLILVFDGGQHHHESPTKKHFYQASFNECESQFDVFKCLILSEPKTQRQKTENKQIYKAVQKVTMTMNVSFGTGYDGVAHPYLVTKKDHHYKRDLCKDPSNCKQGQL